MPEDGVAVSEFVEQNIKYLLLCIIPIRATSSWIVFRRLKFNIAEHLIIGGMAFLGIMLMMLVSFFLDFVNNSGYYTIVTGILEVATFLGILAYPIWTFSNAVYRLYSFGGYLWRILLFTLLLYSALLYLLYRLVIWAGDGAGNLYFRF